MDFPGIGVDLVGCERLRGVFARSGEAFRRKIFTDGEVAYCDSMADPVPHFAARFAAKEAVAKAFGTGIGAAMDWREIEVRRSEDGVPSIVLHGAAAEHAANCGVRGVAISLSHTLEHAIAMVQLRS